MGEDHRRFDNSLRALIGSNVVTIIFAVIENWPLSTVMFVYWAQSVIIGVFHIRRMLDLESFTTDGLKMNGKPVAPVARSKRFVAGFFALHYGFFHLVYFVFVVEAMGDNPTPGGLWALTAGVAVFAVNHAFSYLENREMDRNGSPNLGTMLFLPYARIVPMHLTIIIGASLGGGSRLALVFFLSLKTVADALMHVVEHRALRKVQTARNPLR